MVLVNPLAQIVRINDKGSVYSSIQLWCPGCEFLTEDGRKRGGLNMLPVEGDGTKRPTWKWNGDLVKVTLEPSILTRGVRRGLSDFVCHSFLRNGMWQFLGDSTHEFANQTVPMSRLPNWVVRE